MDQTALGLLLQHLRERRGLKLRELAQLASVDHAYVHRLETGAKERPSDQVLSRLIRGVNADKREAAILRYAAEHAATAPALVKLAIEDATINFDVFATAAGVAFRGAARPDVRRLVERVRRVLDEENDS
ncbi:MAG: helix-turn-helix transcriptional regulator [Acidobacteria bacterium]|nr:helix-turn-helix transcriptional regulator [Acidobacteriota bacterium]